MAGAGVGSIIVVDAAGHPEGIVTDRDLRQRVLAAGRSPSDPARSIMSAPVVGVSPEAFVLEALVEMTRHDIHHLVLVEAGKLVGVVSSHDMLMLQASTPLEVARAIQAQTSVEDLEPLMPRLPEVVRQLFTQGASGYEIGRIVSEINDLVIRRVLHCVERALEDAGLGDPPVPFAWLVLGSEGRREQTMRTDQDNGLVYEAPPPGLDRGCRQYFLAFAGRAIDALVRLGYPRCPADAMASNPRWCQPLPVWRGYFREWARDTTSQNLMYSSIFLDFRAVAGQARLAEVLRDELRAQVAAWRSFPRHLAKIAVSHAPPLGLFGRLRLQRVEGRRGINLKLGAMLLLNNALRAYAIELGLDATNTIERLEAATRAGGCFTSMEAADVRDAYETIAHLRLRHQLAQLAAGARPDNFVDARELGPTDQDRLRAAFRTIRRLQGKVEIRYFTQGL